MMKDSIAQGEVEAFHWIDTKKMLADVFTKDSANSDIIKKVLEQGSLEPVLGKKDRKEAREDCEHRYPASNHMVNTNPINNHVNPDIDTYCIYPSQ